MGPHAEEKPNPFEDQQRRLQDSPGTQIWTPARDAGSSWGEPDALSIFVSSSLVTRSHRVSRGLALAEDASPGPTGAPPVSPSSRSASSHCAPRSQALIAALRVTTSGRQRWLAMDLGAWRCVAARRDAGAHVVILRTRSRGACGGLRRVLRSGCARGTQGACKGDVGSCGIGVELSRLRGCGTGVAIRFLRLLTQCGVARVRRLGVVR
jgi:hypothetical protein